MEVGDKVRLTNEVGPFQAGDVGHIVEAGVTFDWHVQMNGEALDQLESHRGWPREWHVAADEDELEPVFEFEVGDRVRVKPGGPFDHSFDGEVGIVTDHSVNSQFDHQVTFPDDADVNASPADFRATELEPVEEKPLQKGDRVRVVSKDHHPINGHDIGTVGTIVGFSAKGNPDIEAEGPLLPSTPRVLYSNAADVERVEEDEVEPVFEVADRVRVMCECGTCIPGETGTVREVKDNGALISLDRQGAARSFYRLGTLEPVEEDDDAPELQMQPPGSAVTLTISPDRAEELASELRTLANELEEVAA